MREEKRMEKSIYREELLSIFNAKELPSSELIRNDTNLFTFSPIQDEIEKFNSDSKGVFYKEQICFRHVYPANLINPLSTPCQNLISIFSFEETDYVEFIKKIFDQFLSGKVNFADVYMIIPDIDSLVQDFSIITNNIIAINQEGLKCKLPLKGNHYYIKLCLNYYNGLVTVMNFVLVDYKIGSELSKIDSVLFPIRLDMVKEQARSIFETNANKLIYSQLYKVTRSHEMTHFLVSQLTSIAILTREVKESSNHKHGYAIKKLARECFLECDDNNFSVQSILSYFPEIEGKLETMYSEYTQAIDKAMRKIQKSVVKIDAKYAHETLGLPYKLYKSEVDPNYTIEDLPNNFAYYRDDTRNIHTNPIESYK